VKRSKVIRLVLLGGGVATMIAACGDDRARREACEQARAELRPDAEQICRASTSSRSGSSSSRSYWGPVVYGRTRSDSSTVTTRTSSSSRSGFGSTGSRSSS
jgi:hypothetical protein